MAGEKLSGWESRSFYDGFPWLPSWNQIMARERLADRLREVMAALKPAREQKPISPEQLEPIGLADWVGSPQSRAGSSILLAARNERVYFGDDGQLLSRHRYRYDRQNRLDSLLEANYNNPQSEPLTTIRPTSIRSHSWVYDDKFIVAPLVGASYSEYSQPITGLVEQTTAKYWFIPSRILPVYEADFIATRQKAAGEITAQHLGGQLVVLSARVFCPDLGLNRQLKVELAKNEIKTLELIDRPGGMGLEVTFDVKRGLDGELLQTSQNSRPKISHPQQSIPPAIARAILDETSSEGRDSDG